MHECQGAMNACRSFTPIQILFFQCCYICYCITLCSLILLSFLGHLLVFWLMDSFSVRICHVLQDAYSILYLLQVKAYDLYLYWSCSIKVRSSCLERRLFFLIWFLVTCVTSLQTHYTTLCTTTTTLYPRCMLSLPSVQIQTCTISILLRHDVMPWVFGFWCLETTTLSQNMGNMLPN